MGNTIQPGDHMFKKTTITAILAIVLVSCAAAPSPPAAHSSPDEVTSQDIPEPFWDFNPASSYTINYGDVEAILNAMVVNVGRSDREKLPPTRASTGTRLQTKVKRTTANEGNRFHFEEFEDNEEYKQVLRTVRQNLEKIPDEVPLKEFSREEQLAYWLNLYNITMLEQLVEIYPESNLKRELTGRDSILSKKVLNVEGIPLSLNDIQHTILRWNYDDNPLIIYGLYQGIIGGPSIRKWAFTGDTVYNDLVDNAEEFINSNRGTYSSGGDDFHVSSFYARNMGYFNDRASVLKGHLLTYIEEPQRHLLQQAERLVADIDDWTITDTTVRRQRIAGSLTHNRAAMQGAVRSQQQGTPASGSVGTISTSHSVDPILAIVKDPEFSRFEQGSRIRSLTLDSAEKSVIRNKNVDVKANPDESEADVEDEMP